MIGSTLKMIQDLGATSGGRNIGGQAGGMVGGLIGNIWGPIGHMVGQDIGNAAGNRLQRISEGKDTMKEMIGFWLTDPAFKPLERVLPIDMILGGPHKGDKKDPNKIQF